LLKNNAEIAEQKLLLENLAKSAELELLKTQLNPHFLFNALNSIKALVLIDQEKARDAIIKLSELLRFTLNYEKAPLISLNDEINEVIKYLELEQIRFGKRLEVEIALQEETLDVKLPPAMILTLAENAIKHGINQLPDGGEIRIESKLRGKLLVIEVKNSGQLKDTFNLGIGLNNLQKRLQSLFGDQFSFVLDAASDSKVIVKITFPIL
jgi:LytS/YehU family sensor histidine kinase